MMFAYLIRRGRSKTLAIAALGAALCAGGCAVDSSTYSANSPVVAGYVAQVDRVEIEKDGLPVQAAPLLRIRQLPDDPFEPYSPNYGGANPASRRPVPSTLSQQAATARAKLPDDPPLNFMRQLAEATAGSQ